MKGTFEHEFVVAHSLDRVWEVLGAFFEVDWLPGIEGVEVVRRAGHDTRLLSIAGLDTPVEEQLISRDEARHYLKYHVVKNAFVPYEDYEAEMTLAPGEEGTLVHFKSSFQCEEVALEAARTSLVGIYQFMIDAVDTQLNADLKSPQRRY